MLRAATIVLVAVAASFIAAASAGEIPVVNCGSAATIRSIDVSGCDSVPCIFRKGQAYTIDTTFEARNSGSVANLEVRATVSIITIDIIKPGNNNGCPGFSPGCPYSAGNTYTHRTVIFIDDQFVETDAVVTLRILNAENGSEVCARTDVRVVGA